MTNQTPESVIAEVIEYHADAIDTHGPGCYKNHAACLAVKLRDMLRGSGVPDAAIAALERVTAERDSAMARIAKAWELHEPFTWSFGYGPVQSCKWCADHGVSQEVASWPCPTIQALEDVSNDQNLINPHNHAEVW